MSNDKLKKKIVDIVNKWHSFQKRDANGNTIWQENDTEKLAITLIASEIGDVKELKVELRDKIDYIYELDEIIQYYRHRAEIAENALKEFAVTNQVTKQKKRSIKS